MSPSEYQQLTEFFVDHLGRFKQETRAFVEVSVESLRYEIRLVADGVLTNQRSIEETNRRLDEHGGRIDALSQRVERLETTVSNRFADHEERLRVLE